jgi:hypothetical protein
MEGSVRPEARHVPAVLVLLLAVAVSGTGCPGGARSGRASAGPPAAGPNAFAANALWDDGRAEIDAYEASVRRYGIPRTLTAYLIVVKEDLSKKQLVKADPGHDPGDLFPVLKLNHVIDYQTGIYTYHQMASGFFDRATMDLVKFSLTSNEWCGNTYKEYTRRDGRGALHVHAYWDNQAEVTHDVPAGPDVVFYDGLPVWIRSLPQTPGTTRSLRLVPAQMDSKGAKPEIRPATLRALSEELVIVPAGGFRTLRWELRAGDGRPDFFWTSRDYPHVLVAWDRPDGSGYRLKWTQRLAYWSLNRPGDERHLEGPAPAAPFRSPVPSPDPGAPRRSRRGTPGRRGGRSRRGGRPR